MSKKKPSHADAHLTLELYDLRREKVMRESRNTMMGWMPRSYEDVLAITRPTHDANAAWRQVSSYYEMAYGFARHGIIDPDFLVESTSEGLWLLAKLEPHLERLREELSPGILRNAEWMVRKSSAAKERMQLIRKRLEAMLEQPAG